MAIKSLSIPPAFATNQIAGRHNVGRLIENDELLRGVTERWRQYPWARELVLPTDDGAAFTGYHWYNSDAHIFHYTIGGTAGAQNVVLSLKYNANEIWTDTINATATEVYNGTVDLTADPGALTDDTLYTVTLEWTTTAKLGCTVWFRPFFTAYDGSAGALTYTAPHAIVDGDDSVAADEFAAWRNNDLYFQACLPAQFPAFGLKLGVSGDTDIWYGWLPQRFERIYYKVKLWGTGGGTPSLKIEYDEGGASATTETISTQNADVEDFFDVPVDAEGHAAEIRVWVDQDGGNNGQYGTVYYICNASDTGEVLAYPYEIMTAVAVGDAMRGTESGAAGFAILNDNDTYLHYAYSVDENVEVAGSAHEFYGRQDFAVPSAHASNGPAIDDTFYTFIRRGDTLYHRAKACTLNWGTASTYDIPDYDTGGATYGTVDLTARDGLGYGMVYTITTDDGASVLDWAMEV